MKTKPEVGEKLFLVSARDNKMIKSSSCFVTRVGRKYFYVKERIDSYSEIAFSVKDWTIRPDYVSQHFLYQNAKEWDDGKKKRDWTRLFHRTFKYSHGTNELSLNQLKEAGKILGIKPKEENDE